MTTSLNLKQFDIFSALRSYILQVLPTTIDVVKGEVNRVVQPLGPDYVVMSPLLKTRLGTNCDTFADTCFTGSLAGNTLTVTALAFGQILVGAELFGTGVIPGETITAFAGGTGGIGAYTVAGTYTTVPSQKMASGVMFALQPMEIHIQVDVYGPNSEDNLQIMTTLFRDPYAVGVFNNATQSKVPINWQQYSPSAPNIFENVYIGVSPLYADEGRQVGFQDAEQQYEFRWTTDFCMQANQIVTVPELFFDQAQVTKQLPADFM